MADALCGPSNPLQSLQKHSQADRTLQQDRLVGPRQTPGEGFRTATADPRAASLDAEFHAFENAAPGFLQFQKAQFPSHEQYRPLYPPQAGAAAPVGWAADFKRLSLNSPPVPAGQFHTEAPLVRSTPGGWQNDFLRQRSGTGSATTIAQGKQAVREPQQLMNTNTNTSMFAGRAMGQSSMMMTNYSQPMYDQAATYGGLEQQQYPQTSMMTMEQQHAQMSDVDYEAAFAEAMAQAQEMDQQQRQQQETSQSQSVEPATTAERLESIKIGSDAIHYREQSERTAEQDKKDADELARTAGLLLTSVKHDTSSKFQNSQFLNMMRRIRDREVEVQNNDLQTVEEEMLFDRGGPDGYRTIKITADGSARQAELQREMDDLEWQNQQRTKAREQAQQQEQQQTTQFQFPDMDAVYAPDAAMTDGGPSESNPAIKFRSPYTTYGFDDDQYPAMQPQSQMDALHPGGRWYPDQSPRLGQATMDPEMSGAIPGGRPDVADGDDGVRLEKMISASDFEYVDESAGLARRFVR
ncbi:hypothetical protein A1O3_08918 [Capronia epimyces CBS 606.96]|uniref:Peroxin-20 n=1 Tax=Capronia epimyces CBS 606.96 TaxID=1182542 RepID=W9XR32_9EURO|nr:uncharacterized protein A1O3_08918 [Capronia epimyces CBS 606.96]EXJ79416.1 hypothetical protein A1O3_08918 [Capronia epimyces CBS 606.96]